MFFGVILLCGLPPTAEGALNGCTYVDSGLMFNSEEVCMTSVILGMANIKQNLPEGVYISNGKCFKIDEEA